MMSLEEANDHYRYSQMLERVLKHIGLPVQVTPKNHPLDYCDAAIELETRAALVDFIPGASADATTEIIRNGKDLFDNPRHE